MVTFVSLQCADRAGQFTILLWTIQVNLFSLQEIFKFLTEQLAGLHEPEAPSFKRYFYLLEVTHDLV